MGSDRLFLAAVILEMAALERLPRGPAGRIEVMNGLIRAEDRDLLLLLPLLCVHAVPGEAARALAESFLPFGPLVREVHVVEVTALRGPIAEALARRGAHVPTTRDGVVGTGWSILIRAGRAEREANVLAGARMVVEDSLGLALPAGTPVAASMHVTPQGKVVPGLPL